MQSGLPIIGFKALTFSREAGSPAVVSSANNTTWTDRDIAASCSSGHSAPNPACGCGLYAADNVAQNSLGAAPHKGLPRVSVRSVGDGTFRIDEINVGVVVVLSGGKRDLLFAANGWRVPHATVEAIGNDGGLATLPLRESLARGNLLPGGIALKDITNLDDFAVPLIDEVAQRWGIQSFAERNLEAVATNWGQVVPYAEWLVLKDELQHFDDDEFIAVVAKLDDILVVAKPAVRQALSAQVLARATALDSFGADFAGDLFSAVHQLPPQARPAAVENITGRLRAEPVARAYAWVSHLGTIVTAVPPHQRQPFIQEIADVAATHDGVRSEFLRAAADALPALPASERNRIIDAALPHLRACLPQSQEAIAWWLPNFLAAGTRRTRPELLRALDTIISKNPGDVTEGMNDLWKALRPAERAHLLERLEEIRKAAPAGVAGSLGGMIYHSSAAQRPQLVAHVVPAIQGDPVNSLVSMPEIWGALRRTERVALASRICREVAAHPMSLALGLSLVPAFPQVPISQTVHHELATMAEHGVRQARERQEQTTGLASL